MLLVRAANWTICTCTNIKTTALFVPFIWWNCHVLFSVQMHSRALVMTTLLFLIAKCILIHDNNEWWHATPDVTTLMFSVHFGWFYFNVMITLYLSIYISERKHVEHIWRCCCARGERKDLTSAQLAHWLWSSQDFGPMGWVAEPRGWGGTSLLFLQWQVRNKVSPALLLSSLSFICGQDFNCKDEKKEKRNLLWVCYPSKDSRPFSLWFAVRIELF